MKATITETQRDEIGAIVDAMCEAACKHPGVRVDDIGAFVSVRNWIKGILAGPVEKPAAPTSGEPQTFVDKVQAESGDD